jgi:cytochrome c-type biogenesis protein
VQTLSFNEASAGRGALLTVAYCLGLGLPFIVAALAFRRTLSAFGWIKRNNQWVMRVGGGMLVLVGLLLLTGAWDQVTTQLKYWFPNNSVGI